MFGFVKDAPGWQTVAHRRHSKVVDRCVLQALVLAGAHSVVDSHLRASIMVLVVRLKLNRG